MIDDGRLTIGLVGEDEAHLILMTSLADEAVLERVRQAASPWPEREELDQVRAFCGPAPAAPVDYYKRGGSFWDDFERVAGRRIQRINRVGDKPAGEAAYFIDLYRFFALHQPSVQALIVLRDTDGYDERGKAAVCLAERWVKEQLQELRDENLPAMQAVIFGAAHQDAEAWFLVGLTDLDPKRLRKVKDEVGLDPQGKADQLANFKDGGRPERDPKRVLRFLLGEGESVAELPSRPIPPSELPALAERCLRDLDALASSTPGTGLPAFLKRLRDALAPAVLGR